MMSDLKKKIGYLSRQKLARLSERMKERTVEPPERKIERRRDRFAPCQLSFAQQRLWFLDQLVRNRALYNNSGARSRQGRLDLDALGGVINEIVRRHQVLRTRYEVEGVEPVQVIDGWEHQEWKVEDLT